MGAIAAGSLRLLLTSQPELITPVPRVVQRVLARGLLERAGPNPGPRAGEGRGGAVTLIEVHAARGRSGGLGTASLGGGGGREGTTLTASS